MEFDFGNLKVPDKAPKEIEPRALLRSLPVRAGAINDLWDGQAQALTGWHLARAQSDNLVILNTGAGKTIVGLLMAESLRRETNGNVVYLCPTNDLVMQVQKEAEKLGLETTSRIGGDWSNSMYDRGQAVCITNYQALFNARTVFRGERAPSAIVLDDAHVAEGILRDQFTLRISSSDHPELFARLKDTILLHEREASYHAKLSQVFAGASVYSTVLVSPLFGLERQQELNALFQPYSNSQNAAIAFPLSHLYGKWHLCAVCISQTIIEISPPALPTLSYPIFQDPAVRRVYLSATLGQTVEFARAFGKDIKSVVKPDVDAGNGERLILFSDQMGGEAEEPKIVAGAAGIDKVLIAVPSGAKADRWKFYGTPPKADEFSSKLDSFRRAKAGTFVLLGRYDGIDLPQDTCRIMAIDGVPRGVSLIERFCWEYLDLRSELKSKIATRITQLFGRIIRGRVDNGAFIILGADLNTWLSDERNLALLPDLLAAQAKLGRQVHEALKVDAPEKGASLIGQVLARTEQWVQYYRQWVNALEINRETKEAASAQQEIIKQAALAWVQYWSALWGNDAPDKIERLRLKAEEALPKLASVDSRGAGWLNIWLGAECTHRGATEDAVEHFSRARQRLLTELPLPRVTIDRGGLPAESVSPLGNRLLELVRGGIIDRNNRINRDDMALSPLEGAQCSTNEYEEALRHFGFLLGFKSTRPDNEIGTGPDVLWESTLTGQVIGLEAKTEKVRESYNKADVGQAHQHLQWMSEQVARGNVLGVILIGTPDRSTSEASPNPQMYYLRPEDISGLVAKYKDLRMVAIQEISGSKLSQVAKLGMDDEWTLEGVFARLGARPLA